jgi:hypothetical protein
MRSGWRDRIAGFYVRAWCESSVLDRMGPRAGVTTILI